MRTIKLHLSWGSYEILIGHSLLSQVGETLKKSGFKDKIVIITNPVVGLLYGDSLRSGLEDHGFAPVILEVPEGEKYKSLVQAGKLYNHLADFQAERRTPVLALGGGVVGDLAGFVAATYMRGIPLVHLPTTLLSQVDSSIGGKVAVNHQRLKNVIGSFYQPELVITDIATLKTLPEKELENGMAEVIKYGVIRNRALFELLENKIGSIKALDEGLLEDVISLCTDIKAGIVEKDERDLGLRNILNFGHTVGHAIETVSHFRIAHGRAVAIGMVAEGMISRRMSILSDSELNRMKLLISRAGLPVKISGLDIRKLIKAMKHDKKKIGGKIRFALPKTIGDVFISEEVSPLTVEQVLKELYEETQDLCHNRQ
jgi:3-dehydroquinate synthase